jgi:hypothetical protein
VCGGHKGAGLELGTGRQIDGKGKELLELGGGWGLGTEVRGKWEERGLWKGFPGEGSRERVASGELAC